MELKIDLLPKRKKSTLITVFGAVGAALPFFYFVGALLDHTEIRVYYWPTMFYLEVYGILGILHGRGYNPERFFGGAYVLVNNELIAVKTGVLKKVQSVQWAEINSMTYKTNWFEIRKPDDSSFQLKLSDLEFKVLIETRDAIYTIAKEKQININ